MKTEDLSLQVITLLEQEFNCYEQLGLLLEKQKEIIEKKTVDSLLEVMQEIQKIQQIINDLDTSIKESMEGLSDTKRELIIVQTKQIRTQIEAKVLNIVSIGNYCEELIKREKIQIKGIMLNLKQGKNVIRGYEASILKNTFVSKKL